MSKSNKFDYLIYEGTNIDFFQKQYEYTGNWNISDHCYLYINNNLVVATQSPENRSTSITNMGIRLPEMISEFESIPIEKMIFIEHYCKEESGVDQETFSMINLNNYKQAIPERIALNFQEVNVIDKLIANGHLSIKISFK